MTLMTWTAEQFGTKINKTDDEHKTIFSMVNDLHASVGSDRAAIPWLALSLSISRPRKNS